MSISNKAIEAAAKAGYEARNGWGWSGVDAATRDSEIFAARFALEAAVSHIRAQAFQDAAVAIRDAALITHMPTS